MSTTPSSQVVIRTAVTAILIHEDAVFLIRRSPKLIAFSGFNAFPGGKVEESEATHAFDDVRLDALDRRVLHGLNRELKEEVGIDLEAMARAGEVLSVDEMGRATTPPISTTFRFATHFFRVRLTRRPEVIHCTDEISESGWATPARWLERYRAGELLLAPPTLTVLELLRADLNGSRIPESWAEPERDAVFNDGEVYGVRVFRVRSNTLPPAAHTNCFLLGDAEAPQVLVDPSPANLDEYRELLDEVRPRKLTEIFLTHHHPDHREYADRLARDLEIPLGASADTQARIRSKAPAFFDGERVKSYKEGDVLTRWLGSPVRVLEVPGHDEGQLALMPDNRGWCIVGDLIQGVGTVVIAAPEGDMGKYFRTLRRVIDLKPRVIFPSHGIAAGTTHWLEVTLNHREMREEQILGKILDGRPMDDIVKDLYGQLDMRLQVLGRMTVQSHLAKLRAEGRLTSPKQAPG